MKAIIPTGGRGTRMQPITFSANKHFIPIANKPLIFYPIETVADAGIKDILITYNPGMLTMVKNFLGDGIEVCEKALGGDVFLMHNGDNIFTEGIRETVDYFLKEKPNGLVTMVHHKDNTRLGVPYFDENNRLVKYVEKPQNPPHDFAIPGLYFFDQNVFQCFKGDDKILPSERGELEISAPYQWLIDHGYRVEVIEYKGKWLDPGKFDDWLEANQYLLDKMADFKMESRISADSIAEDRVSLGKNSKITASRIKGPVIIGDNVEIKNSYIGPYASISSNCIVEKSHIQNSVIMSGVKIANVERQIDASIIGPGSELMNGGEPSSSLKLFIGEKSKIEI